MILFGRQHQLTDAVTKRRRVEHDIERLLATRSEHHDDASLDAGHQFLRCIKRFTDQRDSREHLRR
ncbi:MAG: hypothetical protein ABW190_08925, partial [Rhizobacter sp.]